MALSLGGYFAPIIILIGTVVVLVNGLVVQRLSKRFTSFGGYYTYAMHLLSERFGFQTGWMYLYFSILFGSAYVIGAVYVINYVFGISPVIVALAITIPAFVFLIFGIRPSAKYAVFAGVIEIVVLVAFFLFSIYFSHGSFYSPISYPGATNISAGQLALAVVFAMGIPLGYSAIAPISGEIISAEKVVGRTMISVILIGGSLAAIFIYGLINLLVSNGVNIYSVSSGSGLVVINLVNTYFGGFGKYFVFILAVAAINDGVLAVLSLSAAASRTIFKMGLDQALPGFFSKQRSGQPIVANLSAGIGIFANFIVIIDTISALYCFYCSWNHVYLWRTVHSSGSELFTLKSQRTQSEKEVVWRFQFATNDILSIWRNRPCSFRCNNNFVCSCILDAFRCATLCSFFLGWIVVGYLLSDVKEIAFQIPATRRQEAQSLQAQEWQRISSLTAIEISSELPDVVVRSDDRLKVVLKKCLELDSPAAIVINKDDIPAGTILLRDIVALSEEELDTCTASDYASTQVATVKGK